MPNTIRLRRGSAAPTASLFAVGEPAWDGVNKALYVKADDNSMVRINPAANQDYGLITGSATSTRDYGALF